MKRLVLGSMAVIGIVMAPAPFAFAQGGPAVIGLAGEDRASQIQFFGDMDLQGRYANTGFILGAMTPTPGAKAESAWVGSPRLSLGVKAALADKVSAVVELCVPRVNGGSAVNYFGDDMRAGSGGINVGVKQAFVKLEDALVQDLSVKCGVQEVVFDLVGANNPLVMALGRAESATAEGMSAGWNFNAFDERRAGGLRLDYRLGAAGSVSLFHMMGVAGGVIDSETVTGLEARYNVTEKSAVEGMVALINGATSPPPPVLPVLSGRDSEIWLIGGVVASNGEFADRLSLFAQMYFNAGTYGRDSAYNRVKANGVLFNFGGSYQFASVAWKPKFGVEYLWVGGNKTPSSGADKTYEGFVSYEDNNDLIVIEDKDFGFDIDQNYSVIKIRASVTGGVAGPVKDNFTLEALLGLAKLNQEIVDLTGMKTDDLGTEIDVKASWAASNQLKVYGGFGFLNGSDVLRKALDPETKRSTAFTFFLGTRVTF